MSAFRTSAVRASLRALTRRSTPNTLAARRGYASQHGPNQSSDLPL